MSGTLAQLQLVSVLNYVAQVVTRVHTEAPYLGRNLRLGQNQGGMPQQGLYRYGWPVLPPGAKVSSEPGLLPMAVSGSMTL